MASTGANYSRPKEGFRYSLGGMKTNSVPDSLPPNKYPFLQNVRALTDSSLQTRSGLTQLFPTSAHTVTDIGSYAALFTDNLPRFLARTSDDNIWLGKAGNTSANVGSLAGGGASPGATLIPFRPAESPNPWLYIANGSDYQKFSAPGVADAVVQQKVGIAEPAPCDAALAVGNYYSSIISSNPSFANTGVATAPVNLSRITDTVASVFTDPVFGGSAPLTIGVSSTQVYTRQMSLVINGNFVVVEDVFPSQPIAIGIAAIRYYTGSTGRCVVVPRGMAPGPGTEGQSLYIENLLGSLRRGALVKFSGGPETCYVWSVTEGPDGTICFETSTTGTHTSAETITQPAAVQIIGAASVSQAITSPMCSFNLTGAGIGKQTSTVSIGTPFVQAALSFQPEDYFHISIAIQFLSSLNEFKVLLDVGDGTFTQNFYYYTVRVSDIEASIQNTLTQLGAAQLVTQRAIIDEEHASAARNQGKTASGDQTSPGDNQWAEIVFPISAFTRVGNDQTKSLQTANAIQYLFNMSGASNANIGTATIFGAGQPDTGTNGAPYLYRARPRSSLTGVKGNPSPAMRYGVSTRRVQVTVGLPSAAYDAQIDTWDIFRYGGTVTSWRKIGQTMSSNSTFNDNYSDEAALAGEELELDNLEPWPSLDLPLNVSSVTVIGTTAVVPIAGSTNALRFLPGNEVRLGSINVYTLRNRPTSLGGGNYLFEFIENAGAPGSVPLSIYEPQLARQLLPYMWGPDAAGTVFACGDPLRPGTLSFAKNYAPDAAPDSYNIEITPPSEPLLGGEILDGLSFVASTERWWALYPQPSNPLQRYSVIQQPITRGLAAPFGHCNDGKTIYWWAKDGICASNEADPITDADLYNLFPHDGVAGADVTYYLFTVHAPDYSRAGTFRLAYCDGYLYADYQDSGGTPRTLVLDIRRKAWVVDVYGTPVAVHYHPEQQAGTVLTATGTTYPLLLTGDTAGHVSKQTPATNDGSTTIPCVVPTMEWDGGDTRAGEQWGDLWLDCNPNAGITVTPMAFGAAVAGGGTIGVSASRQQLPVSLNGEVLSDFLGMLCRWTDDFGSQSAPTAIHIWQPSFIHKPETIADRFTDWYDGSTEAAKYVQGFILRADTANAVKGLQCRDGDTLALHAFTPTVQHNGESVRAYSFNTPFITHTVRLEPTDIQPWRFFDVDWVFEPTPEQAETWQTQGTAHGLLGYMHIKQVSVCYASTTTVTLAITSYDGQSPASIMLPSTSGAMQKTTFILTANKGSLYFYKASASAPFQLFLDNWEIWVGSWQRQDSYLRYRSLGAPTGDQARI
jgi:hypothetical protein